MLEEYYSRILKHLSKQKSLTVERFLLRSYISLWLKIPPNAHFDINLMHDLENRLLKRKVFVFSLDNKNITSLEYTKYILSHKNLKNEIRIMKLKKIHGTEIIY